MSNWLDDMPEIELPAGSGRKKIPHKKVPPDEVVIYHVIRCPKCSSENVPVYTTSKPIRYHKCTDCGHLFKSVEQ